MQATARAGTLSAFVALVGAAVLTFIFHRANTEVALRVAASFGVFAAGAAFVVVWLITRRRMRGLSPVLGGRLGAIAALGTFLITVAVHTAVYPGSGGFLTSLPAVLSIGAVMFGWVVALVGAGVGLLCERLYFSGSKQ
jgi:hypothetical protein